MKNIKKLVALTVATLMMTASLTACSSGGNDASTEGNETPTVEEGTNETVYK